jgi:hypothetical protein
MFRRQLDTLQKIEEEGMDSSSVHDLGNPSQLEPEELGCTDYYIEPRRRLRRLLGSHFVPAGDQRGCTQTVQGAVEAIIMLEITTLVTSLTATGK